MIASRTRPCSASTAARSSGRHALPQDATALQKLCLQATIAGICLDLGEVGQRLPANCRGPSCVTTNGTSATIEDAVDAAAQLRDPFAFNDSFTPEADIRPMAFLTHSCPEPGATVATQHQPSAVPEVTWYHGLNVYHGAPE